MLDRFDKMPNLGPNGGSYRSMSTYSSSSNGTQGQTVTETTTIGADGRRTTTYNTKELKRDGTVQEMSRTRHADGRIEDARFINGQRHKNLLGGGTGAPRGLAPPRGLAAPRALPPSNQPSARSSARSKESRRSGAY